MVDDLYHEVILDHGRRPRRSGCLTCPSHQQSGVNPLCGDHIVVHLQVEDGIIEKVRFEATGCAISVASASLMAERIEGRSIEEAMRDFDATHQMFTGQGVAEDLGKLAVLSGVVKYPMRVKCATLPWHTLRAALQHQGQATTEEES